MEVDGKECKLEFPTNHIQWSAWTVAELYRCRRDIEVFFKKIKQTIQQADFLGIMPTPYNGRSGRDCCPTY